jgi:hypothetical protein
VPATGSQKWHATGRLFPTSEKDGFTVNDADEDEEEEEEKWKNGKMVNNLNS